MNEEDKKFLEDQAYHEPFYWISTLATLAVNRDDPKMAKLLSDQRPYLMYGLNRAVGNISVENLMKGDKYFSSTVSDVSIPEDDRLSIKIIVLGAKAKMHNEAGMLAGDELDSISLHTRRQTRDLLGTGSLMVPSKPTIKLLKYVASAMAIAAMQGIPAGNVSMFGDIDKIFSDEI
jgi:hypothetical protein